MRAALEGLLGSFAVQQATQVIGLLVKAFGFDPVAYGFAPSRKRQGAVVAHLQARACPSSNLIAPESIRRLAIIAVHGVLLSP